MAVVGRSFAANIREMLAAQASKPDAADMKITRDAFLYLPPSGPDLPNHAQCATCWAWDRNHTCALHGKDIEIDADDSCGFYAQGPWDAATPIRALVTPEQSGLVDREVRCENCHFIQGSTCMLYVMLNRKLAAHMDLDEKVEAKACCNAQTPMT